MSDLPVCPVVIKVEREMERGDLEKDSFPQTHSEMGMRSPPDLPSTCSVSYSVHVREFSSRFLPLEGHLTSLPQLS